MTIPTGLQCKAYYNSGTQATPVWEEANLIINLDLKFAWDKVAASCRKSGGVKQYVHGERDDEVSFSLCHDNADTVWEFWRNAAITKNPVHLQILDGDNAESGTEGYTGTYGIFSMDESQQLSSVVEDSFGLAPSANGITATDSAIVPVRMSVA
ncbi:MAG: hypothetical protein RIK87_08440 [Fuerstiella sp.]